MADALKKPAGCRAPHPCDANTRHIRFGGIVLPRVLNPNAAGASVLSADHHAAAVEHVGHGGDEFAAVAGAGSNDRDEFTEAVFGFVDFFVDVFHRSFPLLCLTASGMPMFKKYFGTPEKRAFA
jgi:hypothetical protein